MDDAETLSDAGVARFEAEGFVCLRKAVPAEIVAQCLDRVWSEIVPTPDDPGTWTEPVVRVGGLADPPFVAAAIAPALVDAYDRLVGVRRWVRPGGLGTFPVRFPHPDDPVIPVGISMAVSSLRGKRGRS